MFSLLVAAHGDAWRVAGTHTFDMARCVREYTDAEITDQLGALSRENIEVLKQMPAVFAYENWVDQPPQLGRITSISKHTNRQEVEVGFELLADRFVSNEELWGLERELDLGRWEKNRTHWAVKAVDLPSVLRSLGLAVPVQFNTPVATRAQMRVPVNINTHQFDVAVSFPGDYREFVESVVRATGAILGQDTCFYDFDYQAQLARPGIDVLLQDLYSTRAKLIVVFLGSAYQAGRWPAIEWTAIRTIINAREQEKVMFVRMDDGAVAGVQAHDGYIDARRFNADQIAAMIAQRVILQEQVAG
jgi:hypothetical protein